VKTADDKEIILSIGTQQQFINLARSLNSSSLIENELFKNNNKRVENRTILIEELVQLFKLFTYDVISEAMTKNEVPFSPIHNLKEVFAEPMAQRLVYKSMEDGKEVKRVKSVVFKLS